MLIQVLGFVHEAASLTDVGHLSALMIAASGQIIGQVSQGMMWSLMPAAFAMCAPTDHTEFT